MTSKFFKFEEKRIMRKLFNFLLFITLLQITATSFAQNTWITMLPDTGTAIKMIRTNDGKYLAVSTIFANGLASQKVALCKVNNNGQIEWYKKYGAVMGDTGSFSIYDVAQLSNGNYLIAGEYDWYPFLLMINNNGDSLWSRRYLNYSIDTKYGNIIDFNLNEFWLLPIGPSVNHLIHKFNMVGDIIKIDSSFILPNGVIGKILKTAQDTLTFIGWTYNKKHFYNYDTSLTTMLQHTQYYINPQLIIKLPDGRYMIHEDTNYDPQLGYYNGKGMVCLSSNLDSLFKVEFTQYYNYGAIMGPPFDMQLHSHNGLVLCGTMNWVDTYYPYLIVMDSTYHSTVIKMFSGVIPDKAINVFEEPDSGFVMFQCRYTYPRRMYVVKVNSQGNLTTSSNNYYIAGGIKMILFPNPAGNEFKAKFTAEVSGSIELYDLTGKLIRQQQLEQTGEITVCTEDIPQGIYIVVLMNNQKQLISSEQLVIR